MSEKDEALKLALEALEQIAAYRPLTFAECSDAEAVMRIAENAIPYLQEALAEQPAQPIKQGWDVDTILNKPKQPAQQEPVAVVSGYYNGQCVILPIDPARIFNSNTALYTSPPASKPWVGLTDDEIIEALNSDERDAMKIYHAIEAKLREKNA